jgi:hypothetical protein
MANPIIIEIIARTEQYKQELAAIQAKTHTTLAAMGKDALAVNQPFAGNLSSGIGQGFNAMAAAAKSLKELPQILAGALAGVAALVAGHELHRFADDARTATQASAQFEQAVKAVGVYGAEFAEILEGQRKAISRSTGATDEQVMSVQRQLVSNKVAADQIERLTQLTFDLASAQGIDATSAAIMMGRALGGEEVVLRGIRLEIDKTIPKHDQASQLIAQLATKVGGQAQAIRDATPEIADFKVAWDEAKKSVGAVVDQFERPFYAGAVVGLQKIEAAFKSLKSVLADPTYRNLESALAGRVYGPALLQPIPESSTNEPDLHAKTMDLLRLRYSAGSAAAGSTGLKSAVATEEAQNEAAYVRGEKTLKQYLDLRLRLINMAATEEQLPLRKAIQLSEEELQRKRAELEQAQAQNDDRRVEILTEEYDKLRIENEKLNSQLAAAKQSQKQSNISLDQVSFQNPTTLGGGVDLGWTTAMKNLGTAASNVAATISGTIGTAVNSVSQGITGWIMGTQTWGQALASISNSVLTELLQGMIKTGIAMVVEWVKSHVTMKTISSLFQATETAEQAAHTAARVGIHAAGEETKTATTGEGVASRGLLHVVETVWHGIQVGLRTAAHFVGEVAMTAWSAIHAALRMGWKAFETIWHVIQTGIKVATHVGGETAMTAATIANTTSRSAATLVEAMADLVTAAFKGAKSVADIPYVGPILAVAAMATIIAAGVKYVGGFEAGGRPGAGNLALVGERGPELFIPDRQGTIIPADVTANFLKGSPQSQSGNGAGAGATVKNNTQLNLHVYDDKQRLYDAMKSDEGRSIMWDIWRQEYEIRGWS